MYTTIAINEKTNNLLKNIKTQHKNKQDQERISNTQLIYEALIAFQKQEGYQ